MPDVERSTRGGAGATRRLACGRRGEELAAAHFDRHGFQLIASNVRVGRGELDLILFDGSTLVFAEVKTRRISSARAALATSEPLEGLRASKRAQVRRLASQWLAAAGSRPGARLIRFDAVGVLIDERDRLVRLEHLEGAW